MVDSNDVVVQFLSFHGIMTAVDGLAAGLQATYIDMAVSLPAEGGDFSLQLKGIETDFS